MIRERDGGNGYAGQSDPRLHFGLGDQERVTLLEVRWPDGGVQYLEDVAADQLLIIRQDPSRYAAKLRFDVSKPQHAPWVEEPVSPPPEITPEELDRQLTAAEQGLRGSQEGWALASAYRRLAATYGEHERAIDFLKELVDDHPTASERIELAAAYVDKIPTCGGLATVVCKGTLARKGLGQLDRVIEADPDSWIALYARGMNHLHWPRALRHSNDAARDLRRCIELQELAGEVRPYFLKPHVALGDALVKAGDPEGARSAWRRASALFPDSSELANRLAVEDTDALLDYVEEQRSLEKAIDTDLSFYAAN
jgi:tetratricopeptide (TPR) repeat protein